MLERYNKKLGISNRGEKRWTANGEKKNCI